jgi:hypothetical protein
LKTRFARWAALASLALLASCAHRLHLRPAYETSGRRSLYLSELDARKNAGQMTASLSLWLERAGKRYPGASGDVALLWPDRTRLRVDSAFGTLVDMSLEQDSVSAYVPSMQTGLRVGHASDSLHVDRPAELAVRALSGGWEPPDGAWTNGAVWTDSLLEISWTDSGDSVRMGVTGDGLPALVRRWSSSYSVRVHYRAWDHSAGVAWPSQLVVESQPGDARLTLRASRLKFNPRVDPTRFHVHIPDDAETITLEDLRDLLGRARPHR